LSSYGDLSKEDRIKVIAGLVLVTVLIASFLLFHEFVLDRGQIATQWQSGHTFFYVARSILPSIFFIVFLPTIISASIVVAFLRRRLSGLGAGLPALVGVGMSFSLSYALLYLFDFIFASQALEVQAVLVAIAFFVPSMILALIIRTGRINSYIRRVSA